MKNSSWFLATCLMASVLGGGATASAADTVKIGVLMPLTGNAAAAGQASKAAIEVAADIVNNAHPELGNLPLAATAGLPHLGGAKLDVVFVDHQGNPSLAQQLATRLITEDKVNALMGAYQSSCTFTATPVAERHGIPFMVGDSSALNITTRGFKHVFRATPIATDYARTYMRFFADMKKAGRPINSIAILNENTDYGTSVGDAIEAEAKKNNVPVAIRIPYSASSTDVSAQVLQLKDKKPDVIIFISYTADSILYIKTLRNFDYKPPMVLGDDSGFSDPSFVPAISDIGQGLMNRSSLGHRQARLDHRQDQRNVQGQDRPRPRRHVRPQYAGVPGTRRRNRSRRFDRSGKNSRCAGQDRSQTRAAHDGLSGHQI
jgi:branched-chain amino acid transport system substrate-binding protein